ncbi:MAG TPA: Gfo/Idh/MocA family oxidoreductase [Candidatus Lokiarchaeia archaeon]|nr:Gfo/Idh/MocA family oxidoreductase [Candidatus Lokiarchaeia archaeon]
MAEEPKLRVGMLGYAFMGKAHSNAYRQMPRFFYPPPATPVMKVICGIGDAEVEKARDQLGWEEDTTVWEDVVNREDIDVFDNCGPNNLHKDPCIAAAEAGKNIICEKPLALNAKDAEEMVHAVKNAGVKAMVAFNYRRVPAVVLAKKLIDEGYIGKIYHWRAVYLQDWIMDPKFPLVWRLQKELAGSGPHGDLNAHILDLATMLVGKITKVNGMTETFIKERPLEGAAGALGAAKADTKKMGKVTVEDAAIFMARFENGALGTFEATRFAKGRRNYNRFEINGSKGSLAFNLERFNELEFFSEDDPKFAQGFKTINVTEGVHPYTDHWWPAGHIIGWEHTFIHEIYEFFKAIVEDEPITPSFDDGFYNNKVLDAVLASAAKGTWMNI